MPCRQNPVLERLERLERLEMLGLLIPEIVSQRNRFRKADKSERFKYYLFFGGILAFWVGLFFLFRYVLGLFIEVEVFGTYLVKKLLSVLLLALFSMLCFSNLISALSSYFLSEDLQLIHSLPVTMREIHLARFVLTFVNSSWMMVIFGLPVFLAYGVVYHAGADYYLVMLLFLFPFLAIPTGVGVSLATILVNLFPARRTKELMVVVSAMFLVTLFLMLRIVQPERLVNAESFSDIMVFLGQLKTPSATFMPSHWGTEVLMPLLTHEVGEPWYYLALMTLTAAAAIIISGWTNLLLYSGGWTRTQQSASSKERHRGVFDRVLRGVTSGFPRVVQEMITKDVKMFLRDAAEWPQLLLILALIALYLYSIKVLPLEGPFITMRIHNLVSFMNLAMVGFVVSSVAVRFLFTSVSREGRAFWLLRSAPLDPRTFLLGKYLVGLPVLTVLGLVLVVSSNLLLHVHGPLMVFGACTMVMLSLSMAGLSVGIGAMYPNFKAENVTKIAAGPGGILFMVVAQLFVATVLLFEAVPVYLLVRADYRQRPLHAWEWGVIAASGVLVVAINAAGTIVPMRKGAVALRDLE